MVFSYLFCWLVVVNYIFFGFLISLFIPTISFFTEAVVLMVEFLTLVEGLLLLGRVVGTIPQVEHFNTAFIFNRAHEGQVQVVLSGDILKIKNHNIPKQLQIIKSMEL